jgi:flagellar hook-associated protein 1 FlgK
MNLFNIARGGLEAAKYAAGIVSNNTSNALSGNYHRRDIILGEAGGMSTPNGFFGYGAQINGVQRGYDAFIENQLRGAQTTFYGHDSRYQQLTEIDNMLGDSETNPSVSLNGFFSALKTLSDDPSAPEGRQAAFNKMGSLTYQFNSASKRLTGLEKSTNTQIEQSTKDINSYTDQLAKLNDQIEKISAQTGTPPLDLLDTRDGLLAQLSTQIGIQVNENKTTGRVDVTLADGRPLVSGGQANKLTASASPADPNKTVVSYTDSSGNSTPLNEERITGGKLGGLFKFRNEDLSTARNEVNQIALQMAARFNEVNAGGFDQNGNAGGDLFNIPDPKAIANGNNKGDAALTPSFTSPMSAVRAEDYTVSFNNGNWEVKGADGRTVPHAVGTNGELLFDGLSVAVSGNPQAGDKFMLNPAAGVAENLSVAIKSGEEIAASDVSDIDQPKNNTNLKLLLGIQDEKLIGKATLTEAYASLVSTVGSSMSALKLSSDTAGLVMDELGSKWQAVSGVSLDEEAINLQMYQQYYQANSQVLQTATTLFDTLLAIK